MDTHDVESTATPPRAPGSIRRTVSIDMTWPDGPGGTMAFDVRGRDLRTNNNGTLELAAEQFRVEVADDFIITGIESPTAPAAHLAHLAGASVRSGFRRRLRQSGVRATAGHLVHALLDDLPPASIISDFSWRQWADRDPRLPVLLEQRSGREVTGMCTGFAPGSSALHPDGSSTGFHRTRQVGPLPHPDDPDGWHLLPNTAVMSTRRARRIDVRRAGDDLIVDAALQDSSSLPDGGRVAVHEYRIRMTIDANQVIRTVSATWANLPYRECPGAINSIDRLIGTPVADLRSTVPEMLPGTLGCTHLNDALRCLADVPELAHQAQPEASTSP